MGGPRSQLPAPFAAEAIYDLLSSRSLPLPSTISLLSTTAAYHLIYMLVYTSPADFQILRIAGPHFPAVKTANEVAVLSWLTQHTTIPVPRILAFDQNANNVLGQEWMLLSGITGMSFDKVRQHLIDSGLEHEWEEHVDEYMIQILNVIQQLSIHRWNHVGGLALTASGEIVPAPMVDENLWTSTETAQSWSSSPRSNKLSISNPSSTYAALLIARVEKYEHAILCYPELQPLLSHISLIKALKDVLKNHKAQINNTKYVLAHRDLHYGNVMWNPVTKRITGILDWEFAAVVPVQRWDPPNAFMYDPNYGRTHKGKFERQSRMRLLAKQNGVRFWDDVDKSVDPQPDLQRALNYLRAIVEVLLDGTEKPWQQWIKEFVPLAENICRVSKVAIVMDK